MKYLLLFLSLLISCFGVAPDTIVKNLIVQQTASISEVVAANTYFLGLSLANTGTASSLNYRHSPFLVFKANSWSGSASVPIWYRIGVQASFGSQGYLVIEYSANSGGTWNTVFNLAGSTNVLEINSLNVSSDFAAPSISAEELAISHNQILFSDDRVNVGRFYFAGTIESGDTSLTLDMTGGFRTLHMTGDATVSGVNTGDYIANHTPSSSSEAGTVGKMTYDSSFLYVWTGATTVKRVALSSF